MSSHNPHLVCVPLLLALASSLALAQDARTPDETAAPTASSGTITGHVVNESGQPLADAIVSIRPYAIGAVRNVVTDRDGNFKISGLDHLVYLASAMLPAYTIAPRDPDSTQPNSYRVGDSITIVMIKGGVITGTVTTQSGEPLVGVRVRAQMIRDSFGQPSRYGAPIRERTTDDRGIYRIYGLPTGTYLVFAGGATSGGYGGVFDNDAPTYAPSSTRNNATEVEVRTGEEASNVDIRYRGDAGHSVSGVASGPLAPNAFGFSVTITSTTGAGSQWGQTTFIQRDNKGFAFLGMPDGDYDLTAQSYLPNGEYAISPPKRIRVQGADVSDIELITKPMGSISGRVVLEDSKAIECKDKRRALLSETLVSAWHNEKEAASDRPQYVWSLGGPNYPNQQGEVTLHNLAAGQYQIIARQFAKYWYLQSISLPSQSTGNAVSNRTTDAVANWITLKAGDRLSGLVVTLAGGAGSLRGEVILGDNEALPPRLYAYLVPAEVEKAQDVLRFFAAPIGTDKTIAFNNVAPGRYWIVAQPALDAMRPTLSKLRLPDEKETRARLLRTAQTQKLQVEFKPCQNIADFKFRLSSPSSTQQ